MSQLDLNRLKLDEDGLYELRTYSDGDMTREMYRLAIDQGIPIDTLKKGIIIRLKREIDTHNSILIKLVSASIKEDREATEDEVKLINDYKFLIRYMRRYLTQAKKA